MSSKTHIIITNKEKIIFAAQDYYIVENHQVRELDRRSQVLDHNNHRMSSLGLFRQNTRSYAVPSEAALTINGLNKW